VRFAIEAWAPDYNASVSSDELMAPGSPPDIEVECSEEGWGPVTPPPDQDLPKTIMFTDGVRRVDARVWIEDERQGVRLGICASYAAGAIVCNERARIVATEVRRGLFTGAPGASGIMGRHSSYPVRTTKGDTTEDLTLGLQQHMGELEVELATAHEADLVVIDGPLTGRQNVPGAVGFIKSHRVSYLPEQVRWAIGALASGQRTPLFLTATRTWSRFSWYLKLPGANGHPWAGVVRCETSPDNEVAEVVRLADLITATLPRFASSPHKDPRAPQNLYPIGGLERELRRRLGDAELLYRDLRIAAGHP
jgi:hypothetical protein